MIRKIYNPPVFQGTKKKNNYFEGWYFKQVSADYQQVLAIIPGISLSRNRHAFIQLIDGKTGKTHYLSFPIEDFNAHHRKFEVNIGENYFSDRRVTLNVKQDGISLKGEIEIINKQPWPISVFRPGIMGWYRFVPYMECYHGVVSVNHSTQGKFEGSFGHYDFDKGYGYIEKDWGSSFPEQWIWLHANCFQDQATALMVSVAKIPWRGKFFVGFLGFLKYKKKIFRFFTYNRSRLINPRLVGNELEFTLVNSSYQLHIHAKQLIAGELKAPVKGTMERYIKESVDSEVSYRLTTQDGTLISAETSAQAGLEIVGDVLSLI